MIRKFLTGDFDKRTLLFVLLPLGFLCAFGSLFFAAWLFPYPFHWTTRVISDLTSPRVNPNYYWLPRVGLSLAAFLELPFAGYVRSHLRAIEPRMGNVIGIAFAAAALCTILACTLLPSRMPPILGIKKPHEVAARGCAVALAIGMFSCCWCSVKDRYLSLGGKKRLRQPLTFCWSAVTFVPIGCLAIALLFRLGNYFPFMRGDTVENIRQWFRATPMWHLAFWEWILLVSFYGFMMASVLWLPDRPNATK